jgi:hypothetical protein
VSSATAPDNVVPFRPKDAPRDPILKLGNEVARDGDEALFVVTRYLAGRCDGARTPDGVGFSRYDAPFAHKLADLPLRQWTPRQKAAVYRMLAKYRHTQLDGIFGLIPPPYIPGDVARFERQKSTARRKGSSTGSIRYAKLDGESWFVIDVPFNEAVNRDVRQINGAVFHPDVRAWLVPFRYDTIDPIFEFSAAAGVEIAPKILERLVKTVETAETKVRLSYAADSDFRVDGLPAGCELLPYQRAGVEHIAVSGSSLVADDMGLGKTIQGAVGLWVLDAFPAYVVCPKSVKPNWEREIRKWLPGIEVVRLSGSPPDLLVPMVRRLRELRQTLEAMDAEDPDAALDDDLSRLTAIGLVPAHLRDSEVVAAAAPGVAEVLRRRRPAWVPTSFFSVSADTRRAQIEREANEIALHLKHLAPLAAKRWVAIINYDVLHSWVGRDGGTQPDGTVLLPKPNVLEDLGAVAVVGDEIHYAKNPGARRTKATLRLFRAMKHRIGLTGTPVENRPEELWPLIQALGYEDLFGGPTRFHKRYCYGGDKAAFEDRKEMLLELNQRARASFMIRRTKSQVLTELPPKRHATVPMEMTAAARAEYDKVEADIAAYFAARKAADLRARGEDEQEAIRLGIPVGPERDAFFAERAAERYDRAYERAEMARMLLRWEGLKQVCVKGKKPAMLSWLDDFFESSESKLVLFGIHTDIIEEVAARYKAPMITGKIAKEADRQAAIDRFQNDPACRLIVGNIKAMGVGITLTAASDVAFMELGWNPSQHAQAEDRCHRIGQEWPVTCWYLCAENTIDVELSELIERKRKVVDAVHEGRGEVEDMSIFNELAARVQARRSGQHPAYVAQAAFEAAGLAEEAE